MTRREGIRKINKERQGGSVKKIEEVRSVKRGRSEDVRGSTRVRDI